MLEVRKEAEGGETTCPQVTLQVRLTLDFSAVHTKASIKMSFPLPRVDHFLRLPLASVTDGPHKLTASSQKLKCLWLAQGRTRPIQTLTLEQELEAGSILVRQGDWRQRHSRKKAGDTSKGEGVANSSSGGQIHPQEGRCACWVLGRSG